MLQAPITSNEPAERTHPTKQAIDEARAKQVRTMEEFHHHLEDMLKHTNDDQASQQARMQHNQRSNSSKCLRPRMAPLLSAVTL